MWKIKLALGWESYRTKGFFRDDLYRYSAFGYFFKGNSAKATISSKMLNRLPSYNHSNTLAYILNIHKAKIALVLTYGADLWGLSTLPYKQNQAHF